MTKLPIVAIVGRANVGKSSLFNAILKRREVITASEPGTTRDSIFAKASHQGHNFWIVDTAGMKDPQDQFEFTIQEQIEQAIDSADVIWVVIEASAPIDQEDRKIAKIALKSAKPVFLIINKSDKKAGLKSSDHQKLGIRTIILTSATQNSGIEMLLDHLIQQIPKLSLKTDRAKISLALLGRPNVGKSQMFNTLARKQQALVADRAGTTRDINRAEIQYKERTIELMDTAGIRRSGKIEQGVEKFSVIRTLNAINQSEVCLLLIDVNELGVKLDQKIAGMVKDAGKGLILVISKWDSFDKDAFSSNTVTARLKQQFDFVPWAPLIFTSAITGQNTPKIFTLVLEIHHNRRTLIKTSELNKWLKQTTSLHPPAGLKNKNPKLNYMVQEAQEPINFKIFGAHTKFLHWSYKRYMERRLRESFGFAGTPLRLWFFDKRD